MGSNFTVLKDTNGLLYTFGENKYGELGHGNRKEQEIPKLILSLKKNNEKIIEVYCGFKHVICRTSL